MPLSAIVDAKTRLLLYLSSFVAVFFLAIYGKQVCPFIDRLPFGELTGNLLLIYLLHMMLREVLYYGVPAPAHSSLARHGFRLSLLAWAVAGVLAVLLHEYRYPDFPIASHVKLLSAYWILGGCILSQLEYTLLEQAERAKVADGCVSECYLESMSQRIMEGFLLFTFAPSFMMLLVVARYVYEGFISVAEAWEIAYIGIFCVATALFVAYRYGQHLKKDVALIVAGIRQVEQGHLTGFVGTTRHDELGEMSAGIGKMAQGLQLREKIKEAFGRFVEPRIAEAFVQQYVQQGEGLKMSGERRTVVILMSDIREFTAMSETMEPEAITAMLNDYFSEMVGAIKAHHGIVDKFIGDAIMAVFGLVDEDQDAATHAVQAALAMQTRLQRFNARREAAGQTSIHSGIGIHMGEVVAGYIGSMEQLEFTVIGSSVNLAARIESQAKVPNPPLLFSQQVADQVASAIPVAFVTSATLKGISEAVSLYTVATEDVR
jgi:adenylate cyclase